jgi:hypothetical protein
MPRPVNPSDIFDNFEEKKYQWKTRGENCPWCDIMEGRIYTLDVLITSSVYPGFHRNCNCYLVEVPQDSETSDMDIFGSALNMRNDGWLEALFGAWDTLWLPGWYANPHELLSFAKPGMTAGQALKLLNQSYNFGMFTDYGFPANIYYSWNVNRNVNKSIFPAMPEILKDLYAGAKMLTTGGYISDVITGKSGLFIKPLPLKPLSPAQTYHNKTYSLGGGR